MPSSAAFGIDRFRVRFLILWLLLVLPFFRLLLREDYGFFYAEVALAAGVAAAAAAMLAFAGRTPLFFHASAVFIAALFSVVAVQANLLPQLRSRWIFAGLLALLTAGVYLLRENFYKILLVFLAGSFLADVGTAVFKDTPITAETKAAPAGAARRHVVHIIFDEMQGLGAMPPECASCRLAAAEMEATLRAGNFAVFPYAFSNYSRTRDSIPSLLNADLAIKGTGEYFHNRDLRPYLRKNAYFDGYLARRYAIRTYQSDYILYSAPNYPSVSGETYNVNSLKALHATHFPWTARFRQLGKAFLRSDRFLLDLWERAAPESWRPKPMYLCAVASGDVWPRRILADIRGATRDTLFFAHLLTPHFAYVYKADGSVRTPAEWPSARMYFRSTEAAAYRRACEQYGEQIRFLNRQIAGFLDGLRAAGLYDSTTLILHSDHGSRLRLFQPDQDAKVDERGHPVSHLSRYDYVSQPDVQDLLNRFAALLAIKLPGAAAPQTVMEKASMLYFFRRTLGFPGGLEEPGLNSIFLFDRGGRREVPLRNLWQGAARGAEAAD